MDLSEYPQDKVGERPESRESLVWGTCATAGSTEPFWITLRPMEAEQLIPYLSGQGRRPAAGQIVHGKHPGESPHPELQASSDRFIAFQLPIHPPLS